MPTIMTANKYLQYAIIFGLGLVLFVPLIISTNFFFPFITGKNFAFRILAEIVFGLWLILALRDSEFRPRFSWQGGALAVFLVVIAVADLLSANAFKSFWSNFERMEGFITLLHLGAFFAVASSVLNSERRWTRFFQGSVLVSVIIGVYGILQLAGLLVINQGGVRLDGTLGNAAYLAAYMLLNFFIGLFLTLRWYRQNPRSGRDMVSAVGGSVVASLLVLTAFSHLGRYGLSTSAVLWISLGGWALLLAALSFWKRNSFAPIILSASMILQMYVLYKTETRGAVLGLIFGLAIAGLLWALLSNKKAVRYAGICSVGFIALVVVLGGVLKNTSFIQNNSALVRLTSISASDAGPRFMVWGMAWKGFLESPKTMLLGWGQESFNYVFNKYYNPRMYSQEQWFDRAHDIIFDWLTAGGALGLLAYLSLFVFALYYVWKQGQFGFSLKKFIARFFQFSRGEEVPYLLEKSVLTGLLAGYFFQNLFVFDNITSYILFFAVIAYVHSISAWPMKKLSDSEILSAPMINRIATPAIVVAVALVIYFANVIPMRASATLIDALRPQQGGVSVNLKNFETALGYNTFGNPEIREQLTQSALSVIFSQSADLTTKQQYYDLATGELTKQVNATPNDARYYLFLGSFLNRARNYDLAIPVLQKALSLSPTKQTIMFELGSAYINKGDFTDALSTMKQAYDLAPDFSEARIIYAVAAIYGKQFTLAQSLMQPVAGTAQYYDDRIVQAYTQAGQTATVIKLLQAHVDQVPTDPQARFSLAAAYLAAGQRQNAIATLTYVVNNFPSQKDQANYFIQEIKAGRNP